MEDAHQLDKARFDFLFQLSESYECIQILLTSSENLGESVESRCQLIDIEPFTQKQTSEYARQRVNTKGLDDVVLFIETGGVPGRINDVLDQMLHVSLSADLQQEKTSKGVPISWIIAIAGIVAIVLAYSFSSDAEDRLSSNVIAKKEGITEPRAKEINETSIVQEKLLTKVKIAKKEPTIEQKSGALMPEKVAKAADWVEKTTSLVVVNKEPKAVPSSRELKVERPFKETPKLTVDIEKEKPVALKKETELTTLQKNHNWVKDADATHYTLQLLGVSTKKSANDYVLRHKGLSQLVYFQNKRKKGRWFSVIYGDFKDKAAALKAAKELPASLGKLKPWVRSFVVVRGDLYIE